MSEEIKRLTEEDLEDLVYELIRFCKDWNLWDGIRIFAAGKSYSPFYAWETPGPQECPYDKKGFRNLEDVCICFQDDPKDHILSESGFGMYGLPVPAEPDERRQYVNPELLKEEEDAEDFFEKYAEWTLGSYHVSPDFLLKKFDAIFEKYGIWYDFGFRWSLTTFYRR